MLLWPKTLQVSQAALQGVLQPSSQHLLLLLLPQQLLLLLLLLLLVLSWLSRGSKEALLVASKQQSHMLLAQAWAVHGQVPINLPQPLPSKPAVG